MNDLTRAVKGSQLRNNQPLRRDKSKNIDTSIAEQRAYEFLVRQQEAKEWIQEVVGEKLSGSTAIFCDQLRDGVILAKLAKVFDPASVGKIHQSTGTVLEFMAVDNISKFLQACRNIRLPAIYLFEVTDLWEKKSPSKVVSTLHTLANFLAETGKAIKMKNLQAAGLVFDQEELERAWKDLQDMDGNSVSLTLSAPTQNDDQKDLYDTDSDVDDKLLDDNVASAHTCLLVGDAVTKGIAGIENKFIIQARDFDENELTEGGETFEVKLFLKSAAKSHPVVGTVKDLENGKYEVTYVPEIAGEYRMEIVLVDMIDEDEEEETMLKQCPINVAVSASLESDPSKCELTGLGLSSATAGAETTFMLNTKDRFGNVKTTGGENFSAVLTNKSGDKVEAIVTDNEDGSYQFKYVCPKSGEYELEISLNGKPAFDNRTVTVKDAGVSDASKSVVLGLDKISTIVAGTTTTLTIQAKDKLGNDRSSGGEKFVVTLVHKTDSDKNVVANVVDSNDGKYHVEFVVNNAGDYELSVELESQIVSKTPAKVVDTGVTDPTKCIISGDDAFTNVKAGELKTFKVISCDKFGNPRAAGGDIFVMPIANKETMEYIRDELVSVKDLADGSYEVNFTCEIAGEYGAQLMMKTAVSSNADQNTSGDAQKRALTNLLGFLRRYKYDNVEGFPRDIVASDSGITSANKTEFSGKGLAGVELGSSSSFDIVTYDNYGNKRATGGDKIEIKLHNEKLKSSVNNAQVVDNQNGTYTITFTPETIGDHSIDLSINGDKVDNDASKHKIRVYAKSLKDISDDELYNLDPYNWLASLSSMVALEEDDDLTTIINELRQKLIRQIKENSITEKEVDDLERKIQLLINNRMKIEEVIKSQARRGLFRRKATDSTPKDDQEHKKRLQQLQVYSRMFYLLQAEPKYLSRLFFYVPTEKLEKFLDTIILSLFGFAFSPREEFLILGLVQETVALEASKAGDNSNAREFFNNSSGILAKMIMSYTRRLQGQAFLQKVLYDKILDPIISEKGLNLELNPVKILKALDPSQLAAQVSNEKALENEQVRQALESRKKRLIDVCKNFLFSLIENINEIPYGLRWICKELSSELKRRFPTSTEDDLAHALTFLIFFKFLNPVIVSPDGFQLTKKKISMEMRNNLVVVSKVLSNLVSNVQFAPTDSYAIMNDWISENYRSIYIEKFMRTMTSVDEPEEALGVNEYINLTLTKTPTITITWNEVYSLHALLNERISKICPENEDPLRMVLKSVSTVPDQLNPEDNEEVAIALVNPQAVNVEADNKSKTLQLYHETKANFKKVLRLLPPDRIGNGVLATLDSAEKYAQTLLSENKSEKFAVETAEVLNTKSKAVKNALPALEQEKIIDKESQYRKLLLDITHDIKNQREVKRKQIIERDRLVESIASLEKHNTFLREKIDGLNQYIVEAMNADYDTSKQNKKEFKFSYKHLADKHKVIESSSLNKIQQKAIKFKIHMISPGRFAVDATLAGKTVQTIEVILSDLLDKQSKKQTKVEYDDVTLNVDKTIDILNKLFSNKK